MADAASPKSVPPSHRIRKRAKDPDRLEANPTDPIAQLKQLNELREQGILTDEEFAAEKAQLLG